MTLYSLWFIRLTFIGLTSNLTELDSPYFGGRVLGLLIVRETLSIDIFGINIHLYIFTNSVTVITPIHPPTPMQKTLKLVVWNCLSSAQLLISTSGSTIRGSKWGDWEWRLQMLCMFLHALLNVSAVLTPWSSTGWHGESGKASWVSHLAIESLKVDGSHVTTWLVEQETTTKMTSGLLYVSYDC